MFYMMTITQVAEMLKVSEQSAYGLLQYLKEIGQVTVTDAPPNGKRGRRAKLYTLSTLAELQLDVFTGNLLKVAA